MAVMGSARQDENGKLTGGKAGDNNSREVMTQAYYMHKKGWFLLRAKDATVADALAEAMLEACNNDNIGYDQSERLRIIEALKKYGSLKDIKEPTECDCSSLVRACCIQAGFDPKNFTTASEVKMLSATNMFQPKIEVKSTTILYKGDVLITRVKGHTGIVTEGDKLNNTPKDCPYIDSGTQLRLDMCGEAIKWLQWQLNQHGYGLVVDGIYGTKTLAAVKDFQAKNGINNSGLVGPKTRKALAS